MGRTVRKVTRALTAPFRAVKKAGKAVKKAVSGTPAQVYDRPLPYTPQQLEALDRSLGQGQAGLENILQQLLQPFQPQQQAQFGPIREQAERQFYTEELPALMERLGSPLSSDYQGRIGAAGAGLQSQLAAMEQAFGERAQERELQQAGFGLQRQGLGAQIAQFMQQQGVAPRAATFREAAQPGIFERILPLASAALGAYAGAPGAFQRIFNQPAAPQAPQQVSTEQAAASAQPITAPQGVPAPAPAQAQAPGPYLGMPQTPFGQYATQPARYGETPEQLQGRRYRDFSGAEEAAQRIANSINIILSQQNPGGSVGQRIGGLR